MGKKAVSPLVASILLLAFTVSIFVAAGPWLSDMVQSSQDKQIEKEGDILEASRADFEIERTERDSSGVNVTFKNSGAEDMGNYTVTVYCDNVVQEKFSEQLSPAEITEKNIQGCEGGVEEVRIDSEELPVSASEDVESETVVTSVELTESESEPAMSFRGSGPETYLVGYRPIQELIDPEPGLVLSVETTRPVSNIIGKMEMPGEGPPVDLPSFGSQTGWQKNPPTPNHYLIRFPPPPNAGIYVASIDAVELESGEKRYVNKEASHEYGSGSGTSGITVRNKEMDDKPVPEPYRVFVRLHVELDSLSTSVETFSADIVRPNGTEISVGSAEVVDCVAEAFPPTCQVVFPAGEGLMPMEAEGNFQVNVTDLKFGSGASLGDRSLEFNLSAPQDNPPSISSWQGISANATDIADEGGYVEMNATDYSDDRGLVEFRWDFDSDGVYEHNSTDDGPVVYQFGSSDTHNPSVTVVDSAGQTDSTSITIKANGDQPPNCEPLGFLETRAGLVDQNVRNSNGHTFVDVDHPFKVTTIQGTASGCDDDRGIQNHLWDFDFSFDDGFEVMKKGDEVSFTYNNTGDYTITISANDTGGNTYHPADVYAGTGSVKAIDGPKAIISPNASVIRSGSDVELDGSNSLEIAGSIDQYKWDLDNDSVFENTSTQPTVVEDFNQTTEVTLEVVGSEGETGNTSINITVWESNLTASEGPEEGTGNIIGSYNFSNGMPASFNHTANYPDSGTWGRAHDLDGGGVYEPASISSGRLKMIGKDCSYRGVAHPTNVSAYRNNWEVFYKVDARPGNAGVHADRQTGGIASQVETTGSYSSDYDELRQYRAGFYDKGDSFQVRGIDSSGSDVKVSKGIPWDIQDIVTNVRIASSKDKKSTWVKFWAEGEPEPESWSLEFNDTYIPGRPSMTAVGTCKGESRSNYYDFFEMREIGFSNSG